MKIANVVDKGDTSVPTEVEKSFERNRKRPPTIVSIPLPAEGTTRLGTTTTTMEKLKPSWDS
jgi:hypothetical protein